MPGPIASLLARYGYAALFAGVFLESAGVPLPGETVLLAAAFFAREEAFSLPLVIGLAAAAAILGDNLGYWIGRRAGRPLAERHGRLVGLTPARLAALDAFFARHGPRAVFLARFVSGLRVVAAPFAGMTGLGWSRFVLYQASGAVLWATAVGLAGYLFGQSWDLLGRWVGRAGLVAVGLAAALVLAAVAHRYGRRLAGAVAARLPTAPRLRGPALVAATLAAVAVFAELAEIVVRQESAALDTSVSLAVHRAASPPLDLAMRAVTAVGSLPVALGVVLAAAGWCLRRRARRAAGALVAVTLAALLLESALKLAVHRARPSLWPGVAAPASSSFPSGHAMRAVAVYGMVAIVVARLEPRLRRPAALLAPLLALAMGLSRVYLGVHWPTDVAAGFAAGAAVLLAGLFALERHEAGHGAGGPAGPPQGSPPRPGL